MRLVIRWSDGKLTKCGTSLRSVRRRVVQRLGAGVASIHADDAAWPRVARVENPTGGLNAVVEVA